MGMRIGLCGWASCVACVAAISAFTATRVAHSEDPIEAQKLYDRAVALQGKDDYVNAKAIFKQVVAKYPDTEWGRKAKNKSEDNCLLRVKTLLDSGKGANRVDICILGDGYTISTNDQRVFDRRAAEYVAYVRSKSPVSEYESYFNFHQLNVCSKEDGFDTMNRSRDTALGRAWGR
jgi:hypothetical protein